MKKQTNNFTRARLDYFLPNDNSTDLVKKVGIGRICSLFAHRPIYLHLSLSKVQKGRVFWRLNGDLLVDPQFIFGCNHVIRKTILSYSEQYKNCDITNYPPDNEISLATPEISYILLHDVILMNVRAYAMKYQAKLKREAIERSEKINEAIEELANSDDPEDITKVNLLKEEAQEIEDERETTAVKMQLEGEKPTKKNAT